MHIERLSKLVQLLENLPQIPSFYNASKPFAFNLTVWRDECGTSACAVGFAAMDSWFQQEGLSLMLNVVRVFTPFYKSSEGSRAVSQFFEIDHGAAVTLFYPEKYRSVQWRDPKAVAQRIREFMGEHQPPQPEPISVLPEAPEKL